MSIDEYYAAVGRLGLKPTKVPHVFVHTGDREHYWVPDATKYSPEERRAIIEKLTGQIKGY